MSKESKSPFEMPERAREGYVQPLANRVLHWCHAALIVFLAWTGLQIAHPTVNITGFGVAWAVLLHKIGGVLLLIQMPLWLLYRIGTTRFVWRDLPRPCDFWSCGWRQLRYYLFDIFVGRPHPYDPRQLNPLQRITYFLLMIVVLPVAMLTGAALMWPGAFSWLFSWLGIVGITRLHLVLAYIFVFFILMHIYLSTTGSKPYAYFKAMFTGWVHRDEIAEYEKTRKAEP